MGGECPKWEGTQVRVEEGRSGARRNRGGGMEGGPGGPS